MKMFESMRVKKRIKDIMEGGCYLVILLPPLFFLSSREGRKDCKR